MTKELYEAIDNLWANLAHTNYTENYSTRDRKLLIEAVKRLEAIDNANPSEALSRIEDCFYEDPYADRKDVSYEDDIATIKQALLKAQEQEEVLEILKIKKYIPFDRINPRFWNDKETYNETCNYEFYLWLCEEECEYVVKEEQKLTEEEFDLLKRWLEKGR